MKKFLAAALALAALVAPAAASAAKFAYSVSFDVVQFGNPSGDSYGATGTFEAESLGTVGTPIGAVTLYGITGATGTFSSNFNANLGTVTDAVGNNLALPGFGLFGDGTLAGADFTLIGDRFYAVSAIPFVAYDAFSIEVGGPITSLSITPAAVPEPMTWAMMILGFGVVGAAMRRRPARGLACA